MAVLKDLYDIGKKQIGNIIGIPLSIAQSKNAKKLQSEADAINPPLEDPRMTRLLDSIKRKASAISSGTDPLAVEQTKAAGQGLVTTQSALINGVGGDSNVLLSGLRRTQGAYAKDLAGATAVSAANEKYYTGLAANLADTISTRALDLTMAKKAQKLREAAELRTTANKNISGLLGQLPDTIESVEGLIKT